MLDMLLHLLGQRVEFDISGGQASETLYMIPTALQARNVCVVFGKQAQ
jgi:hypothetical protein